MKVCAVCGSLASHPSPLDLMEKRKVRKWGQPHFYGEHCWWCTRAISIRYAYLSGNAFAKWVGGSAENLSEAKATSSAYLSLREEGRAQVSIDQLFKRIEFCDRIAAEWPAVREGVHSQISMLEEHHKAHPDDNPILAGCEIVQIEISGKKRLGVKHSAPLPPSTSQRPAFDNVKMSAALMTDEKSDWYLLEKLASKAPAREVVAQSPKSVKKQAMRL